MDNYAQRPTANLKSPADKTNTAQGLLQRRGAQTIFGRTLLPWGRGCCCWTKGPFCSDPDPPTTWLQVCFEYRRKGPGCPVGDAPAGGQRDKADPPTNLKSTEYSLKRLLSSFSKSFCYFVIPQISSNYFHISILHSQCSLAIRFVRKEMEILASWALRQRGL